MSGAVDPAVSRHQVAGAAELREGERLLLEVGGREVGIFCIKGRLVAWENRCPHQGGPVCTGELIGRAELVLADDKTVVREQRSSIRLNLACPWHGWEYDIETGVCPALPSRRLRPVLLVEGSGAVELQL
jgi:nitrite reductase/ring-hydroxylating ferredoxin subunit